jgi:hypothetical protein
MQRRGHFTIPGVLLIICQDDLQPSGTKIEPPDLYIGVLNEFGANEKLPIFTTVNLEDPPPKTNRNVLPPVRGNF